MSEHVVVIRGMPSDDEDIIPRILSGSNPRGGGMVCEVW